jgi:hypothetical protein
VALPVNSEPVGNGAHPRRLERIFAFSDAAFHVVEPAYGAWPLGEVINTVDVSLLYESAATSKLHSERLMPASVAPLAHSTLSAPTLSLSTDGPATRNNITSVWSVAVG